MLWKNRHLTVFLRYITKMRTLVGVGYDFIFGLKVLKFWTFDSPFSKLMNGYLWSCFLRWFPLCSKYVQTLQWNTIHSEKKQELAA